MQVYNFKLFKYYSPDFLDFIICNLVWCGYEDVRNIETFVITYWSLGQRNSPCEYKHNPCEDRNASGYIDYLPFDAYGAIEAISISAKQAINIRNMK